MMKNVVAASAVLAALLGLGSEPAVWAKPPDLPVENQIQCPDCGEQSVHGEFSLSIDFLTKRVTIEVKSSPAEVPPMLDTVTPSMLLPYIEQLLQGAAECPACGIEAILRKMPYAGWFTTTPGLGRQNEAGAPEKDAAAAREKQAIHLFKIAESCRRNGDFAKARVCYQQVHLLTPTSRYGQLAIDRLVEVEERMRESSEESEVPARQEGSDQSHHDLRERTKPLGMVTVTY